MHHFVRLAGVGRCVVVAERIDVELATKDAFVELHGLAGIVPEVQVRVELGRHDPPCIRAAIQESCTTRPLHLNGALRRAAQLGAQDRPGARLRTAVAPMIEDQTGTYWAPRVIASVRCAGPVPISIDRAGATPCAPR